MSRANEDGGNGRRDDEKGTEEEGETAGEESEGGSMSEKEWVWAPPSAPASHDLSSLREDGFAEEEPRASLSITVVVPDFNTGWK